MNIMKIILVMTVLLIVFPTEVAMISASSVQKCNVQKADGSNTALHANSTTVISKKTKRRKKKKNATASGGEMTAQLTESIEHTSVNSERRRQSKPAKSSVQSGQESATLRRIKREWKEAVKMGIAYDWKKMQNVAKESDEKNNYVRMGPYGNNLLKWHFSVMGPPHSEFDGGIYHGRVLLPKDYPGSPPRVQVLTPSGRFISGHDICLSASNYHPESWTPKWTIVSLIDALRLHMMTQANEIGGTSATPTERRKYARASRLWAMGRISHPVMVGQGIFGWKDSYDIEMVPTDSTRNHTPINSSDGTSGVHSIASQVLDSGVECLQMDRSLTVQVTTAAIEVFKSPRLTILILLALFVVLNLKA